ncbi:uncharacterized protein [Prorops nasuta]|uniref:uncharacterized protein n=1 Tax=Prorops nasuta TaxID=863751 RepID=UPI0034CFF6C7
MTKKRPMGVSQPTDDTQACHSLKVHAGSVQRTEQQFAIVQRPDRRRRRPFTFRVSRIKEGKTRCLDFSPKVEITGESSACPRTSGRNLEARPCGTWQTRGIHIQIEQVMQPRVKFRTRQPDAIFAGKSERLRATEVEDREEKREFGGTADCIQSWAEARLFPEGGRFVYLPESGDCGGDVETLVRTSGTQVPATARSLAYWPRLARRRIPALVKLEDVLGEEQESNSLNPREAQARKKRTVSRKRGIYRPRMSKKWEESSKRTAENDV